MQLGIVLNVAKPVRDTKVIELKGLFLNNQELLLIILKQHHAKCD